MPPEPWGPQRHQELHHGTRFQKYTPQLFLGCTLALTSHSTMNVCNCHLLGMKPRDTGCSMVVWAAILGRDQRGACSALKPAEVRHTLLLPSNSLRTEQTQSTPPSNKVQSLAQEDLGNAADWLLADATHR